MPHHRAFLQGASATCGQSHQTACGRYFPFECGWVVVHTCICVDTITCSRSVISIKRRVEGKGRERESVCVCVCMIFTNRLRGGGGGGGGELFLGGGVFFLGGGGLFVFWFFLFCCFCFIEEKLEKHCLCTHQGQDSPCSCERESFGYLVQGKSMLISEVS